MDRPSPFVRWADLHGSSQPVVVVSGRHDRPLPLHAYDFWELQVVARGTARHTTADGSSSLVRGSVVLLRPGAWHRKDAGHGLISWACCWPSSLWQGGLAHLAADDRFAGLLRHREAAWLSLLNEAAARVCLEHLRALGSATAAGRIAHACLILDAIVGTNTLRSTLPVSGGIMRVLDEIDAFPDRAWSVAGASRRAGVSTTHFARCCRTITGRSPLAYLTMRRLERASALLLGEAPQIAKIAATCGFRDADYFARCFRRHLGCAPRHWRRHVQGLQG